jgi:signal transduction histidine kinase
MPLLSGLSGVSLKKTEPQRRHSAHPSACYACDPLQNDAAFYEMKDSVLLGSSSESLEVAELRLQLETEKAEKRILEKALLAAGEEESKRIGQELHDNLCQQLLGISFGARVLARNLEKDDPVRGAKVHELVALLNSAVDSCRELVRGLNFSHANDLLASIRSLAAKVSLIIPCEVITSGDVAISSPEIARNAYRIALEAVSNAMKHSHATRLTISLTEADDLLTLEVLDDGVGFSEQDIRPGMGFRSMNLRTEAISGTLTIDSKNTSGVKVTCIFNKK